MISYNNRISLRQFQILTIVNVLGTGIIVLPRKVCDYAMEDAWISIIIGTIFAIVSVYLMTYAVNKFGNDNFVQSTSKIFTKPIGIFICLIFGLKILGTIGLELKIFGEITNQMMLPKTPTFLVIGILLLISGYVASKGIEVRARLSEILILMVIVFVVSTIIMSAYKIDLSNLKPILKSGNMNILKGSFVTFFAFSSISYSLLAYPFVCNKKEFAKGVSIAVLVIGFIMLSVTVIGIGKFSAKGVERQLWPVLEIMNAIDLPGSFIERQDALVMSFWIFAVFASINAGLYYSAILLKGVFKKGKHIHYIIFGIVAAFLVSFLPENLKVASYSMDYVYLCLSSVFMVALPILMIVIGKIRKVGLKNEK